MTITAVPVIKNGCLMVRGKVVLTGVPDNVAVSPASSGSAFLGANSTSPSSCHVFNLGVLESAFITSSWSYWMQFRYFFSTVWLISCLFSKELQVHVLVYCQDMVDDTACWEISKWDSNGDSDASVGGRGGVCARRRGGRRATCSGAE